MSRIRKTSLPFRWNTVNISFTQGTANTVNLATFVQNQQNRTLTYSVIGTLPTGVSLAGAVVSYNGVGAAAASTVQFRITDGTHTAESAQTTVAIAIAQTSNTAPTWKANTPTSLGTFTAGVGGTFDFSQHAFDAEGDPIFYYRTGGTTDTAPGTVTVNETTGLGTIPASLSAGSYSVAVRLAGSAAEADWLARSTDSGVVWAHDFRNIEQVTQFTIPTGSNPSAVSHYTADGIGNSKVLRITIPKGLDDGYHWVANDASTNGWIVRDGTALSQPAAAASNADWTWATGETLKAQGKVADGGWWRPFSAIAATQNGLSAADPAANGTLPVRQWTSAMLADSSRFRAGYYAHSTYSELCRTWPAYGGAAQTDAYDGSEFYLQFRVKYSEWRHGELGLAATGAAKTYQYERYPPGKLAFIGVTGTTPNHEIVVQSLPVDPRFEVTGARYSMYTNFGNLPLYKTKTVQSQSVTVIQPGGDYDDGTLAGTCYYDGSNAVRDCWYWPTNEWVTVLIHVIPGRHNANHSGTNRDTGVEVWVARTGETSYTKVMGVAAADIAANTAFPFVYGGVNGYHPDYAWNSFLPTGYMNNAPSLRAWTHDFTQIIFSKQFIPCPQA